MGGRDGENKRHKTSLERDKMEKTHKERQMTHVEN